MKHDTLAATETLENTASAAAAIELSDEALEAAAEMTSAAHGTGHFPIC